MAIYRNRQSNVGQCRAHSVPKTLWYFPLSSPIWYNNEPQDKDVVNNNIYLRMVPLGTHIKAKVGAAFQAFAVESKIHVECFPLPVHERRRRVSHMRASSCTSTKSCHASSRGDNRRKWSSTAASAMARKDHKSNDGGQARRKPQERRSSLYPSIQTWASNTV